MSTPFSVEPPSAHLVRLRPISLELEFAEALAAAGRHAEARAAYSRAIARDDTSQAEFALAMYLVHVDEYAPAIDLFLGILNDPRHLGDGTLRSAAANNLAAVYRMIGRFDLAATFQQQSIGSALLEEAPDDVREQQLCCDLTNRACDAIAAGQWDLAEDLLRRSLWLEVKRDSPAGQANDLANLAIVAGLQGRLIEGVRLLWQAYRLHWRTGQQRAAGTDLVNLAEFYADLERRDCAAHCLRRAVKHFQESQAGDSLKRARHRLEHLERIERARQWDPQVN